jgi:hypothetical protein
VLSVVSAGVVLLLPPVLLPSGGGLLVLSVVSAGVVLLLPPVLLPSGGGLLVLSVVSAGVVLQRACRPGSAAQRYSTPDSLVHSRGNTQPF